MLDTYRLLRARSNENCVQNNSHYLCAAKGKPQGLAGYELLVNYLLNLICTDPDLPKLTLPL